MKKPSKPHKDFPLFAHASGQWAKKIRQKMHYFGVWADPEAALEKWLAEKDDLLAGRVPRCSTPEGPTLADLMLAFLGAKSQLMKSGELSARSYADYVGTCGRLVEYFGRSRRITDIHPADFVTLRAEWAEKWGPVRLGNEINRARVVFRFGRVNKICEEVIYGDGFARPSARTLRVHRAAKGPRMIEPAAIRKLLDTAKPQMRAMILLGVNCGYGNRDVGLLPIEAIRGGWVEFARPKTGIPRRCPLWPETCRALAKVIGDRKTGPVFLTRYGRPWTGQAAVSHEAAKMGFRFYDLRHAFETIGGESRDQVAVDSIMGHADPSMGAVYRERISDERLETVTNLVRRWVFSCLDQV